MPHIYLKINIDYTEFFVCLFPAPKSVPLPEFPVPVNGTTIMPGFFSPFYRPCLICHQNLFIDSTYINFLKMVTVSAPHSGILRNHPQSGQKFPVQSLRSCHMVCKMRVTVGMLLTSKPWRDGCIS